MLDVMFWITVGAFIGWHLPEPFWAKLAKEKVIQLFRNTTSS